MTAFKAIVFFLLAAQICCINGAPAESNSFLQPRSQLNLIEPRIVGGKYVNIEDVPYQAILEQFKLSTCGATIIGPRWLLTAAQCTFELDFLTKFTSWVRVGSTTSFFLSMGGTVHFMEKMLKHPKHDYSSNDYDLGLIQVKTAIAMTPYTQPVAMQPPGQGQAFLDYEQNATVSGWGATTVNTPPRPISSKRRSERPERAIYTPPTEAIRVDSAVETSNCYPQGDSRSKANVVNGLQKDGGQCISYETTHPAKLEQLDTEVPGVVPYEMHCLLLS